MLVDEGAHQTVFAQKINDARNAHGVVMNRGHGFRFKNLLPVRACDAQPLLYVGPGFVQRQSMRFGPECQTLPQLPQLGLLQLLFQFRLSHQNNLQQLFRESLQIGEHPDLFQHFVGKILGLIDDQHGGFTGPVSIQ